MPALTERAESALDKANPPTVKVQRQGEVEARIKRAQGRLKELAPSRKEAVAFANNEHYVSVGKKEKLVKLDTVPMAQGGEKPDHRVRLSRDLIRPILKAKISATTQRTPSYESTTNSPDAEDYSAQRLAEKIATGGYDLWQMRAKNKRLAWNAFVTKEGFARAFWNPNVGPFVEVAKTETIDGENGPEEMTTDETEVIGMGEVGIQIYSGLEVSWEAGVEFEDSPWYVIERARPVEEIEDEPGFQGGELSADATISDSPAKKKGSKLCMETEYLERPCPKWTKGRRLIFAGGKIIFPEEDYPRKDVDGNVLDEPCLHRVTYDLGPDERGEGLVTPLIESMRAYDQAGNKFLEWVQLTLTPQTEAEVGTVVTPMTDEPGAIIEYEPLAGGNPPKVRQPGPVPPELERWQERAKGEMAEISHDSDIAAQQAEGGKQAATLITKAALAWQDFIEDWADLQGRLMRDCLTEVQIHYTEQRLVKFRGRTGWQDTDDFKGADLRGQTDLRVSASRLEPRTRASNEQRIMNIANMFPGLFPPEVLISALEGGSAEKLIEGYEDDVARANRIITLIRSGQFWSIPMRPVFPGEEGARINPGTGEPEVKATGQMEPVMQPDPMTGAEVQVGERPGFEVVMETELPGWMPRPFDNIPVQKTVLTTWMKTDDWANLDEASQRASMDVYDGMLRIEQREAQRQAEMQSQMATDAGMSNAAKLPQGKPMPSLPALSGSEGE